MTPFLCLSDFSAQDASNVENISRKELEKLSPSQLGQDLWVLESTNYKEKGFFVEFGATNGILLSNGYMLEKYFEWDGICAEPNPKFFKDLSNNRQCITSNACISGRTGDTVSFILGGEFGGIEDFALNGKHKNKVKAYKQADKFIELTTISLHDFLMQNNAPKDIDYLSIDTEGSEFEILKTFPFNKWNIKLLTIEHNFEPQREKLNKLLLQEGYKCIEAQWDDWYVKK